MKSSTFLLAMAALAAPAYAEEPPGMSPRTSVRDARALLLVAIQASNGQAHGVLTGELANAITQRFGAISPIFIDITTERRYQQPGCSRLKVLFWQDGVLLPGAIAPRKQTMEFGINYCRDGSPPKSLR
ncbi:hypothetical protein [Rhodoferax sp.]|uniref:hypothetical protein n=1 Tax=Rhodoferax sp. TaxID=50421 RepID=UPI0028459260|nr:hypothetical protein [Rhodoferax sp.]MDR3368945.1 hypothetical protein [Rhodoferax sp.]